METYPVSSSALHPREAEWQHAVNFPAVDAGHGQRYSGNREFRGTALLRFVVCTLAILASIASGQAATRVALVIGNGAYTSLTPTLPNPSRDAAAISTALTSLGFTVDTVIDGTKSAMDDALARLAREARTADVVLLFYAGHGIQDQDRNYLAPVDAALDEETDLRRRFVRLDDVLDDLSSAKGARILLLDACRDNDAVEALRAAVPSRAAGVTRGLARITAVNGQLVAFATQPDRVATDGAGENSPFTTALVKHIKTPGIELRTALTRVRLDVATATNNDQIPEVTDSLLGEIYLSSAPAAGAEAAAPATALGPAPAPANATPTAESPSVTPSTDVATAPATPPADGTVSSRIATLEGELRSEKYVSERALAQVELLNQQIAALRRQVAALEEALNASEARNKDMERALSP